MTWSDFYEWLEANGINYFAGDIHYAGRGYWFPRPPELDGSEDPKPFGAWIRVSKEQGTNAVFVDTSFEVLGSTSTYASSPDAARAAVEQALVTYEQMHGGSLRPAVECDDEPCAPVVPARREPQRPVHPVAARMRAERDAYAARKKAGTTTEEDRQRWIYGRDVYREEQVERAAAALKARDEREKDRKPADQPAGVEYKGEALKMRGLGMPDDDGITDLCDRGECARCSGCEHRCHDRPERIRGQALKVCSCGRLFTQKEWDRLPLLGEQKLEADGGDPACIMIAKNCSACGSTMFLESPI